MKVNVKSSFCLALLVFILLNADCRATSLNRNGSSQCNGPIDECFINDMDVEVLLDTETSIRQLRPIMIHPAIQATKSPGIPCNRVPYKGKCYPDPKLSKKPFGIYPRNPSTGQ